MARALLLLDVDGPLHPWAAPGPPQGYAEHRLVHQGVCRAEMWLNPEHGPMLTQFARAYDLALVWATTWEHEANLTIGPILGLPELPVIEFGVSSRWKFDGVLDYAGDQPLAWLDDDFHVQDPDQCWFLRERSDVPTLLLGIEPEIGLERVNLAAVARWLREEGLR